MDIVPSLLALLCFKYLLQSFPKIFLHFLVISATWLFDSQIVSFCSMCLSFLCLFSIHQLREMLAKMKVSALVA